MLPRTRSTPCLGDFPNHTSRPPPAFLFVPRGYTSSGDIDLVLSHPQGPCPILEELIQRLTHDGLLTDHLSLPQGSPELEIQTYMGVGLAPLAVGTAAERPSALVASAPTDAGTTGDVGLAGTVAAAEGAGAVVEPGLEPITTCDGKGPASSIGPCEAPECGAEGHGATASASEGTAPHFDPPAAAVRVRLSGQHSHQLHRCARSLQ